MVQIVKNLVQELLFLFSGINIIGIITVVKAVLPALSFARFFFSESETTVTEFDDIKAFSAANSGDIMRITVFSFVFEQSPFNLAQK